MYVGVILIAFITRKHGKRIPHVCGGDPYNEVINMDHIEYSPCMWG